MRTERTTAVFLLNPPVELRAHLCASLADVPGLELVFPATGDEAELVKLAARADVLVGWRASPAVLTAAERLKLYIFAGVGAQSILPALRELNTTRPVTLVKCIANTYATAQHAVALLLALMNRIVPHHNWMAAGLWRRGDEQLSSVTLRGRRIGLLGYGAVNRQVHRFLAPFDVTFAIMRREPGGVRQWLPQLAECFHAGQLDRFLDEVDILIVGVPLTEQTTGLLGAPELRRLGPQGLLVNVARGAVIDERSLYEALRDRTLAGAALDVWYQYQPEPDPQGRRFPSRFPFHELDNVVLSPHRAASPVFDLRRWDEVGGQLRRFCAGEPPDNVVDYQRGY